VLGTRAYLAGCGGFQRSVLSRLASEALGNLASPGSAMFEMLYEIAPPNWFGAQPSLAA